MPVAAKVLQNTTLLTNKGLFWSSRRTIVNSTHSVTDNRDQLLTQTSVQNKAISVALPERFHSYHDHWNCLCESEGFLCTCLGVLA